MLDGISPSSFEATSWSFPAMTVWFEVIYINPSCNMACGVCPTSLSIGGVVVGEMMRFVANVLLPEHTQEVPSSAHVEHRRSAKMVDHNPEP